MKIPKIKKRSNIFSVDRGINHKQNGKLLQQGASGIDKVFCPFGLIPQSTKNILKLIHFLSLFFLWITKVGTQNNDSIGVNC